jgi:hypothetical protein
VPRDPTYSPELHDYITLRLSALPKPLENPLSGLLQQKKFPPPQHLERRRNSALICCASTYVDKYRDSSALSVVRLTSLSVQSASRTKKSLHAERTCHSLHYQHPDRRTFTQESALSAQEGFERASCAQAEASVKSWHPALASVHRCAKHIASLYTVTRSRLQLTIINVVVAKRSCWSAPLLDVVQTRVDDLTCRNLSRPIADAFISSICIIHVLRVRDT